MYKYIKSSIQYLENYIYSYLCKCKMSTMLKRDILLCKVISYQHRILECNICNEPFKATESQWQLFSSHIRSETVNELSNDHHII